MLFNKKKMIAYPINLFLWDSIQKVQTWYPEEQVISMLEFHIDNTFVEFGGRLFKEIVGIPM